MSAHSPVEPFTVFSLTKDIVERAYADVWVAKMTSGKHAASDIQKQLYMEYVDRALAKLGDPAEGELRAVAQPPALSNNFASALWTENDFLLPAVMGHALETARKVGLISEENQLFTVHFQRSGWLNVAFVSAEIHATEERRKATALAYGQVVAYSTCQVLEDKAAVEIGLNCAWRMVA